MLTTAAAAVAPQPIRWMGFVAGALIVFLTIASLMRTLVVPRGVSSRLSVFVGRQVVFRFYRFLAARFEDYATKDRILAVSGPSALIFLLLVWLSLFLVGYGLMLWPLTDASLLENVRESGSSLLTLGFASHPDLSAAIIYFLAAVTGLITIALQIAYLPTLYASFNRRELLVTTLQSRAGAPAWGPELLARHQLVGLNESLKTLYFEWEHWAADLAETHATYPVLVWFRSPHPLRSWVLGLLAVLDSAALYQSLNPSVAPAETRLCLRMGFTALRSVADAVGLPYDPDPFPNDPVELTYEEYHGGIRRLEEVGFPMERTAEEAWDHFKGWRVNYESLAYAFADLVVAPPGPWSGTRKHLPGLAIIPERPADRTPRDPTAGNRPKASRTHWRA